MASLSQALRLGDLPPPHRTFQGHAAHIIEWSMMLRPNGSWGTCIPQGIATFLHYASRRSATRRYATRGIIWRTQGRGADWDPCRVVAMRARLATGHRFLRPLYARLPPPLPRVMPGTDRSSWAILARPARAYAGYGRAVDVLSSTQLDLGARHDTFL